MIKNAFGNKVKELRLAQGLSQSDLASAAETDRPQISKIEQGKINVTLETIEKLSSALNVPIQELMDLDKTKAHPFVKWAGGKTQLLNKLKELMPKDYNKYFEPFIGGGALFFDVHPKTAIINDQNSELVCAYKCFKQKQDFNKLIDGLVNHEKNHSEEYFYKIRKADTEDNFIKESISFRAARMIYLNKACFNGLYRVNSKGFFNVPSGGKEKVKCYDEENYNAIFAYFNESSITILNGDYAEAVSGASKGDFVYFDPPYDVYPNTLGFVDYGKNGFGKDEQARLASCFKELSQKGVLVMLSNHNTPYINELYKGFNIHVVNAKRMINSKGDGRGNVEEVIITNY